MSLYNPTCFSDYILFRMDIFLEYIQNLILLKGKQDNCKK